MNRILFLGMLALLTCCNAETEPLGETASDTGIADRTMLSALPDAGGCSSDDDCEDGLYCRWWSAGCGPDMQLGVCSGERWLDACGGGCNDYCGCDGVTRTGWAIGPFAHHGACASSVDAGASD